MPALTMFFGSKSGAESGSHLKMGTWTVASVALLCVLAASLYCEPLVVLLSLLGAALIFFVLTWPVAGFWLLVALAPIETIGPVPFSATKALKLALPCLVAAAFFLNVSGRRVADSAVADRDGSHRAAKDAFRWPWLLFAVSGFLASVLANTPLTSMAGLASLLTYVFLYQAVRRAKFPSALAAKVLQAVCILGVLVSFMALAQTFGGYASPLGSGEQQAMEAEGLVSTPWPGIERASALFNVPTAAGAFLALAAVIAVAHVMVFPRRRPLYIGGMIICVAGMLATFSRGAILGCAAGIGSVWVGLGRWHARRLIAFLLPLALASGALLTNESVRGYLRIGADLASVSPSRLDAWHAAFAIIPQHPLFGIGFYQFQEMSQGLEGFSDTPVHPHNGFLKALVEQGPLGALAYLLFAATFVKTAWRSRRAAREPERRWIFAAVAGAGIALFTHELFDAGLVIGGSSVALLFACLLAMQASLLSGADAPGGR